MNIKIVEEPSQAVVSAIEQQISGEPKSSIATIQTTGDEAVFKVSYMAATVNEEPAGIALIRSAGQSTVELHKLVVLSRFRRTGVGTSLFLSLVDRCRREGLESIMIDPTNGSEHFWEKALNGLRFQVYEHNGVIDITL
ncbi:GNAT family N-acetyltransferase [Xanthomonas campestris pv. raphani]|uniref:GNAT family N-acetyltransferase n=1 Tax=Xanthomonas campestris TaxID=339 RepID=UPI002B23E992|nr:GNAT family N-acetyltransferase [Xanthomonas campestris]MEA9749416.1 GNAT family N-acetyltransferase [Xanthomonas campestris pv. raphani]MEA9850186.1 GNAT family N-acetyltransferase [Xanthomonas campestris pv. raphani]MEA9931412.1 GNAT family N-acetyltransferase [Xanthomonas campestris pv. raphani]